MNVMLRWLPFAGLLEGKEGPDPWMIGAPVREEQDPCMLQNDAGCGASRGGGTAADHLVTDTTEETPLPG